jgi:serine carboxypeptidase-like clade 1
MVGNPVTDHKFDDNSLVPFAHGMGLISDQIFEVRKNSYSIFNHTS